MKRSQRPNQNTSTFKAIMVGYYAVGKTSIQTRFSRSAFDEDYHMTLNSSSVTRLFCIENDCCVKLQLIDTLGNGLSKQMVNNLIPQCDAILLVYDLTNQQTFYRIDKWLTEMRRVIKKEMFLILVGTHLDQPYKRKISEEEALQLKKRNNIALFFEVSCKTNENIGDMFDEINKHLLFTNNKSLADISSIDQLNPQVSIAFQNQINIRSNNSRIIILEKKLQFKEMECNKLWIDFEDALRKIESLESYRKEKSEGVHFLSSFKQCSTEIDQLQCKIRTLEQSIRVQEQNIRVQEQFYTSKQLMLEQSICRKIQQLNKQIQGLQAQIQNLNVGNKKLLENINEISHNRDQFRVKINSLQFDLAQKNDVHSKFQGQLNQLLRHIEQRMLLIDDEELHQRSSHFNFRAINALDCRLIYLLNCLQQKSNSILQKDYNMKLALSQYEQKEMHYEAEIQRFIFEKQVYEKQIQSYEQTLIYYRAESILKVKLEQDIANLNKHICGMQHIFNIKQEQYQQIIDHKQKIIKLLIENSKVLQEKLTNLKIEFDKLYKDSQQKSILLTKKEEIIKRIIDQKVNQITQLKGFIEDADSNSTNLTQNYSTVIQQYKLADSFTEIEQKNARYIQFFNLFLEKLKIKSVTIFQNFNNILSNFQSITLGLSQIKQQTFALQTSEYLFDCSEQQQTNDKQYKLINVKNQLLNLQLNDKSLLGKLLDQYENLLNRFYDWRFKLSQNESNRKVNKIVNKMCSLLVKLQSISLTFRQNLSEIHSNIELIQSINEVEIDNYVSQYFN